MHLTDKREALVPWTLEPGAELQLPQLAPVTNHQSDVSLHNTHSARSQAASGRDTEPHLR